MSYSILAEVHGAQVEELDLEGYSLRQLPSFVTIRGKHKTLSEVAALEAALQLYPDKSLTLNSE